MLATHPTRSKRTSSVSMGLTPTSYGLANCPPTGRPHWPPTSPRQSIIWQKLNPRLAWDDQTYLLADIRDSLAFLAWTKTKEASRKGARWRGQLQRPRHRPA